MIMHKNKIITSSIVVISMIVILNCCLTMANDEDLISCGGFVKVSKSLPRDLIDYEKIKINLIQDTLVRESTECAPNGYYFLPIYKSGEYQIEIEGPEGWSFSSKQIPLTIDISNKEICKEDINFELVGFRVEGRVSSKGCSNKNALDGITIQLRNKGSNKVVDETKTSNGGLYRFESVVPSSELEVIAVHPTWKFSVGQVPVNTDFTWGNQIVQKDIVIEGFELTGKIMYDNHPMKGVDFTLEPIAATGSSNTVQSGEDGQFLIKNVACGEYKLSASYKGKQKYFIEPSQINVRVEGGAIEVPSFQVKGFSVHGRVLNQGEGLAGVSILVNGKLKTTTDAAGNYALEQITAGTFKIEAQKDHMTFSALQNYRMSPSSPSLPDIKVLSYDVCGQVSVPIPPAGIKVNPREITLQGEKNEKKQTDSNGRFCFNVAPGTYKISIAISSQEKSKGLQFVSQTITTTITNKPMLDIIFSQTRGSIVGKIRTLAQLTSSEVPSGLKLSLEPTSRRGDTINAALSVKSGDISFIFRDLLPGSYKVHLSFDAWCWESLEKSVNLEDTEVKDDIEFIQTGYQYQVVSPHDQVSLDHQYKDQHKKIQLKKGSNSLCLKESGVHKFDVKSCFQFEKNIDTFDTEFNQKGLFKLKIEKIQLTGSIKFPSGSESTLPTKVDIQVRTKSGQETVKVIQGEQSTKEPNVYAYSYMAKLGDELEFVPITPASSNYIFYPSFRSASVNTENCPPSLDVINAREGLFIRGQVFPNIAGVEISTFDRSGEQIASTVQSDNNGHYQIGPLRDDIDYTLKAAKPGYHFKKEDKGYNFNAIELGSVVVNFRDKESNQPIQGVLLSLSGEGYRNNLQSPVNGSIGIYSLFPGKYFVKCLLKEYAITPSSQTIEVLEGKEIKVEVVAKRVAYSVYGNVKSLINEPQQGVVVRALTANNKIADESTSDESGAYRLRGLQPNEKYRVAIVGQPSIERSAPAEYNAVVEKSDITNMDFVVLSSSSTSTFDLTASVELRGSQANHNTLQNLRANLYNQRDNTLYRSIEFGFTSFVDFGSLPKSNNYVLKVENFDNSKHSGLVINVDPQEIKINNNEDSSSNQHYKFRVEVSKSSIVHEQESVPYSGLIFFALVVVSVLYPSKVWNFILSVKSGEIFQKKSTNKRSQRQQEDDNDFLPKDLLKQNKLKKLSSKSK